MPYRNSLSILYFWTMVFNKTEIHNALQDELPGSKSHYKMLPPDRVLKPAPQDRSRVKRSSVLLLLFEEDSQLKILLIKRPLHMKHHAGQIALPGGRIEINETAIQTALRETHEEIGIDSEKIEIIGKLTDFYVEVSRFQIQPIVGWLSSKPVLKINPEEVENIVFFPVEKFAPPYDTEELDTITGKLQVPCVRYQYEIIWGATAMILSELFDVLMTIKKD